MGRTRKQRGGENGVMLINPLYKTVDPEPKNNDLIIAIINSNAAEALRLIDNKVDINSKDILGNTALALSCYYKLSTVTQKLKALGAIEPDERGSLGKTAAICAAKGGYRRKSRARKNRKSRKSRKTRRSRK